MPLPRDKLSHNLRYISWESINQLLQNTPALLAIRCIRHRTSKTCSVERLVYQRHLFCSGVRIYNGEIQTLRIEEACIADRSKNKWRVGVYGV